MVINMNVKYLIGTVVETLIKIVVLVAVIIFVFRSATQAYDFGYRVFADEPMSISGGRIITVGVAEGASIKDIAAMLEEKGLIEDSQLFVVQELLSAYHDEIIPGIYDLSTDMTAEQMLEIMSTPADTEDAGEDGEQDIDTSESADTPLTEPVETEVPSADEETPAEDVAE